MAVMVQKVDLSKFNYLTVPHTDSWGLLMRKDDPLSAKES